MWPIELKMKWKFGRYSSVSEMKTLSALYKYFICLNLLLNLSKNAGQTRGSAPTVANLSALILQAEVITPISVLIHQAGIAHSVMVRGVSAPWNPFLQLRTRGFANATALGLDQPRYNSLLLRPDFSTSQNKFIYWVLTAS